VIGECRPELRAPVGAFAADQARHALHRDVVEGRLKANLGRIAGGIRGKDEAHTLEVHEQCVGSDVVGLERLGIERCGIVRRRGEIAAVEHQLAADLGEPGRTQCRDERLELLDGDLRIAVALEHEIALEHRARQPPVSVRFGFPAVVGSQQLERGERRDELHRRRGIHRLVRPVRHERTRRADFAHVRADRGERNAFVMEDTRDGGRKRGTRAACHEAQRQA
jgi:hypothetical protein